MTQTEYELFLFHELICSSEDELIKNIKRFNYNIFNINKQEWDNILMYILKNKKAVVYHFNLNPQFSDFSSCSLFKNAVDKSINDFIMENVYTTNCLTMCDLGMAVNIISKIISRYKYAILLEIKKFLGFEYDFDIRNVCRIVNYTHTNIKDIAHFYSFNLCVMLNINVTTIILKHIMNKLISSTISIYLSDVFSFLPHTFILHNKIRPKTCIMCSSGFKRIEDGKIPLDAINISIDIAKDFIEQKSILARHPDTEPHEQSKDDRIYYQRQIRFLLDGLQLYLTKKTMPDEEDCKCISDFFLE